MNILFIGPYKNFDGWGEASRDYIKSILTIPDVNLAIRPIYVSKNYTSQVEMEFVENEYKVLDKYDVVIQKCLPHNFCYFQEYGQNIGLCVFETKNINNNAWPIRCSLMDKLCTPVWLQNMNLPTDLPIYDIGQAVDLEVFKKDYGVVEEAKQDNFIFYFIGENITRKNWLDLVLAFHTEFDANEPAQLLLKISGGDPGQTMHLVDEKISRLKERLRLYKNIKDYKQDIVITEFLSKDDLYKIHQTGDCFVMPSYGEAFCRPMVEAMGFQKPVLVTANTGMAHFVPEECRINSHAQPVECKDPPLFDLYTGREIWYKPDIMDLRRKMRAIYEQKYLRRTYDMTQFSHQTIGQNILHAIQS